MSMLDALNLPALAETSAADLDAAYGAWADARQNISKAALRHLVILAARAGIDAVVVEPDGEYAEFMRPGDASDLDNAWGCDGATATPVTFNEDNDLRNAVGALIADVSADWNAVVGVTRHDGDPFAYEPDTVRIDVRMVLAALLAD